MLRLKRVGAAFAALLALLGGVMPTHAQTAGWHPNEDDSLLFDARLGRFRLGDGVRAYQTPEGVCVNLPDMVAALDIPLTIDKGKNSAQGWAFDEHNQIRIERGAGKARIASRVQTIENTAIRDTPEGWCVALPTLSSWLGIELKVDLKNALLTISSKTKLPVELAAERRARAARVHPTPQINISKLKQVRLPYRMWRMPSLDAVVTVGGLKDSHQGNRFTRQYELYASGEVARMSVDARLASNNNGVPSTLRMRAYRSDATGGLLGPLHATHFEVGDVISASSALVAQSQPGRGVMMTNRPLERPDTFDRKTFRGELPTGWDAELYRNEQLLAVSQPRSDGRYEFVDVPLLFGQNRIEIVLYGPQGQVRRNHETIMVGLESIPPKQTWYWAGINEARKDLLSWGKPDYSRERGWRATLGIERGLDQRTSFLAQVHSMMLDDDRLTYAEGAVRRSVGSALVEVGGALESHGGVAGHAQMVAQFGNTYVTAESVVAHNFTSDRVEKTVTGRHSLAIDHTFDLGKTIVPIHLEGRYVQRAGGASSLEGDARISTSIGRFSITGTLDWRMQHAGSGPDPPDTVEASLLGNGSIGKTRIRGEMRWRLSPDSHFQSATLIAERRVGERTALRGELGYDHDFERARVGLGYVRDFKRFSLSVTGEGATDGSVAAGLNLAFSLGSNPRGGMRVTSQKLAAAGTVLARVYRDENNDGIHEQGEPYEKDVQLLVERMPTAQTTDATGELVVDGLAPHLPVLVAVDASSLPDPLVQPASLGVAVTPRPGLTTTVDLPLVGAGEIIGTLVGTSGHLLEGVDIDLIDDKGLTIATARSDFDGYFLFESVPYGSYRLRLNKLSAAAAGLDQALDVRATLDRIHPSVRLGRVEAGGRQSRRLAYADVLMQGPHADLVLAH
jgi:hypothetical protein